MTSMIKLLHTLLKVAVALVIITCIGQVPVGGVSLELRYHRFVNTAEFQNFFWSMATPVTWTYHKGHELVTGKPDLSRQYAR